MEQFLKVGVITSPHGVQGEVRVYPTTDDPARFKKLKQVILVKGAVREERKITGVKFVKNMVILRLEGITSVNEAQKYREFDLMIDRSQAVKLKKDEYFIADLVGMQVFTEDGEAFGELADVLQTGANDVYVVKSPAHGEVLIPAIKQCIISVDIEENKMVVHLLNGLIND